MSVPYFRFVRRAVLPAVVLVCGAMFWTAPAHAQAAADFDTACSDAPGDRPQRVVCADLVALDQMLVYNRFGSFNPYGMIFALRRDVVAMEEAPAAQPDCGQDTATHAKPAVQLRAGEVRLRDCRRPRPLVLRANVGDLLFVRVQNLLAPEVPGSPPARDLSRDFCPDGRAPVGGHLSRGSARMVDHHEALCEDQDMNRADNDPPGAGIEPEAGRDPVPIFDQADWPRTRSLNLLAEGLMPLALRGQPPHPACRGLGAAMPNESFDCLYEVVQEGTHFFASRAAPAGGEGDGGSITHGLFGAVMAERPGTRWYRSQVSQAAMDAAWAPREGGPRHARSGGLDYERTLGGIPVLNMARAIGTADFRQAKAFEIVHADLNAIIWCDHRAADPGGYSTPPLHCKTDTADKDRTQELRFDAFREFSVFFHDELKTFYTRNFEELARFGQLAGVRDGFAINYGASGMGTMLLANRKGIGPAAACAECLYEEFFLTSWANGDPALLEWYADDPSNVHHSYLNDPVVFRNFHAGPKETHVFHLHAHQWFAGNDQGRGSYLDSQTVAPGQGFTYNIYHGGRGREAGAWGGSGNRNRTVGDSIFHCHLYPHFAQGMWALWRVHDVFEDGSRKLPDGQDKPGLSADIRHPDNVHFARAGSVDPETGAWLDPGTRDEPGPGAGTPIPALVPLPGEALPPLPRYADPQAAPDQASLAPEAARRRPPLWRGQAAGGPERLIRAQAAAPRTETAQTPARTPRPVPDAMPGYPFYVAGQPGHRPPQAPHDIARALGDEGSGPDAPARDEYLSGGLGRHVITKADRDLPLRLSDEITELDATLAADLDDEDSRARLETLRSQMVAKALALGDMTAHLEHAWIRALDPEGEPLERAAQAFHHDGAGLAMLGPDGDPAAFGDGAYRTPKAPLPGQADAAPVRGAFDVNGAPPAPGAPFSDPCGGAPGRDHGQTGTDPLTGHQNYAIDPALTGFRRYRVSAVQLDLVVNQAGWHDPQARIDVLTSRADNSQNGAQARTSDAFKLPGDPGNRISPTTRDDVEPFFFRALSGECIEFRHTNELPKDLELDDFQVKTPTDTIGQHIHLVKFDVTSSDGSGNGWNYEDGTFAADELMARRCAALRGGSLDPSWDQADLGDWGTRPATEAECSTLNNGRIWRLPVTENRHLFQTTVQRWFADPIMALDGKGGDDAPKARDRTMRTVFSHDHFGPSSIQQHGFYTALLIEPDHAEICDPHGDGSCKPMVTTGLFEVREKDGADWTGTHKIVKTNELIHDDYREFALAVADFALLYDPRDREDTAAIEPRADAHLKGMARIYCEALSAAKGLWRGQTAGQCGPDDPADPVTPPAWWAAGAPGDWPYHRARLHGNLMDLASVQALREHLVDYRSRAASPDGKPVQGGPLAKPVAPPERPESISVDHHDPYLVNYRNAPLPLRLGTKNADGSPDADCEPLRMARAGQAWDPAAPDSEVVSRLMAGTMPRCSYAYQLAGDRGDAGNVLRSWHDPKDNTGSAPARDPETPQFEAYQDERTVFRLIQGAQEVQHVFNIAGMAGPRNIDQRFSQGMRDLAVSVDPARKACFDAVRKGYPEDYETWLNLTPAAREAYDESDLQDAETLARYRAFDDALANCDNLEGYTFAQEVGISEHFEVRTRLRSDVPAIEMRPARNAAPAFPTPTERVEDVSDYLYNFGTLDALWNGAWGLLRIYKDQQARTALLDGWKDGAAPETLVPIDRKKLVEARAKGAIDALPLNEAPGCPLPDNPLLRHTTMGLVVALRTADIWDRGTDYGGYRSDPDGLMLALLNPAEVTDAKGNARDIGTDAHWQNLPRAQVIAAVRKAYARPEPFVMRVNAGDCVELRYVNLLQEPPLTGTPAQRHDQPGDALMPKITPLNTDAEQAVSRSSSAGAPGQAPVTGVSGVLTPLTAPATGLRPSARLGLSIGLPGGDLIRNLPLGYGINRAAMAPATADIAQVSGLLRFYAGRMRIVQPDVNVDLPTEVFVRAVNSLETAVGWSDLTLEPRAAASRDPAHATVLGKRFTLGDIDLTSVQAAELDRAVRDELHRHIHWIPYAFGPVPVRVTGDVVSQTTHGLFGVIDVLPRHWTIPETVTGAPVGSRRAAKAPGDFQRGVRYENVVMDPGYDPAEPTGPGTPVAVREFVIFYQDGLNHHDSDSRIRWNWQDGTPETARIVPDCPVCDDSYDWGDQGVSYQSRPFASLLRRDDIVFQPGKNGTVRGAGRIEASDDLNTVLFPPNFFDDTYRSDPGRKPITLMACPGEQVLIRVVHPGGRARQRAFVMNGLGYDDLFPGFGFPNAALVAPGKVVSAWLHPRQVLGPDGRRQDVEGKVLWHDGPTYLMAGGTWGLVEFNAEECERNTQ
ncbi:hypothetical protein PARHAE_02675 [Paracoccus haematequi]|uniref:Multicopper oxidase n=1 Tax=Paracoccus haematequi TaxID=2491866 RepID=A0A447IPN3_9RHOB|nr:hypothetical protein [Paracoccus haematequi]VDS09472.1 hypothetical protein PARHAE_02675 [Paracoccus haematequi]